MECTKLGEFYQDTEISQNLWRLQREKCVRLANFFQNFPFFPFFGDFGAKNV